MYGNKLAAAIKVNGKVLREFNKDTVYIPFASEYSFLIKNLNTKRCLINVYVDGDNQTPGGLVLNAGQEVDLERSIKNGNLTEGNRFKFIERTSNIEQHRGVKLEDGIVRIEFQFEQYHPMNFVFNKGVADAYNPGGVYPQGGIMRSIGAMDVSYSATNSISAMASATSASYNDTGITVPGSRSTQSFSTTTIGTMETEKHTMVFKLLGETPDNAPVRAPVTTKHKPKCTTCGKQNKATAKFCTECGTALEIFA